MKAGSVRGDEPSLKRWELQPQSDEPKPGTSRLPMERMAFASSHSRFLSEATGQASILVA